VKLRVVKLRILKLQILKLHVSKLRVEVARVGALRISSHERAMIANDTHDLKESIASCARKAHSATPHALRNMVELP
jgi:coenzyme F420-reducing hydrogenase delta subunit